MERTASKKIFEKSQKVIPGGVNSPARAFSGMGIAPLIVKSGDQDTIVDHDGFQYIDYSMSGGSLILGHRPPHVIEAVQKQLEKGTTFGVATEEELQIAEWITTHVASVEKVRFVNSGTEASTCAVRLARAFTQRKLIVTFEGTYHGSCDALLDPSQTAGVLEESVTSTVSLPYNDVEAVTQFFEERGDEIAAIIVEPIATNMGLIPASGTFLGALRQLTIENKALLIFNELITGFRVGLSGSQGIYGIEPDLTCFGKILGGGFPAAAIGGSREVMDYLTPHGDVFHAGSMAGNPVAMAAGLATLKTLESEAFYEKLKQKADVVTIPVQAYIKKYNLNACVHQVGSMFTVFFGVKSVDRAFEQEKEAQDMFRRFFQFLFVKGIYISPSQFETSFASMAHEVAHLEKTRDMMLKFLSDFEPALC